MVGGRHRAVRGARDGGAELDPGGLERPELDGIGRRRDREQLAVAVPDDDPAVEAELELDPPAGIATPARPGRQLEDRRPRPDGVVIGDERAPPDGFEPPTPALGRLRSIH
jgi:hypothetical protein